MATGQPNSDLKQIPQRAQEGEERCSFRNCAFKPVPGRDRCPIHKGEDITPEARGMYALLRTDTLIRLAEVRSDPEFHQVTTELGLTRIMLERLLNTIETQFDFQKTLPQFVMLVDKIDRLVATDLKIAEKHSTLLSVERVVAIAQTLVDIVATYISDPVVLEKLATEVQNKLNSELE